MVPIPWLVLGETEAQRREAACSGAEVGSRVLSAGPAGLIWERVWVRLSEIKGWHSGIDYFSPSCIALAWPPCAPQVPRQTRGDAWSKAGVAIPTVHPLPGVLEGAWAVGELRAGDLSQAHPPHPPIPLGFGLFAFLSPYSDAGISSGICYLIPPFCLLPLPYPACSTNPAVPVLPPPCRGANSVRPLDLT